MANINVRRQPEQRAAMTAPAQAEWDPGRWMRSLLSWDPFREMSPFVGEDRFVFSPAFEDLSDYRPILAGTGVSQVPAIAIVKPGNKAVLVEGWIDRG